MSNFHHDYDLSAMPAFEKRTDVTIGNVSFTKQDVKTLLKSLDCSKAGGIDRISNRMIHLVADTLDDPLYRLLNKIANSGIYPNCWKLGEVIPIFKNKGSKSMVSNYRPVTLLNSLSKIFEKLIYSDMYNHVIGNELLFERQSGFLKGHDTIKQLLSISHMLHSNMDNGLETRGVFLDIAGAFDAVPHELLLLKLKGYGITGTLFNLLQSYLSNRCIQVRVGEAISDQSPGGFINSGVPQGSILGPLLFLIYINDLADVVHNCLLYLYADDSSLFLPVDRVNAHGSHLKLQDDLDRLFQWSMIWKLDFKAVKSKEVVFRSRMRRTRDHPLLNLGNEMIERVDSHKHLGIILDQFLSFEDHITSIIKKVNSMLNPLSSLKPVVNSKHLETIYMAFIIPHLEYGSIIFDSATQSLLSKLDQLHYRAALLVSGCMQGTSAKKVFACLNWNSLEIRRKEKKMTLMFDVENGSIPYYVKNIFNMYVNPIQDQRLRRIKKYRIPTNLSNRTLRSTVPSSIKSWEHLPQNLKTCQTKNSFRYNLRAHLNTSRILSTTKLDLSRQAEMALNKTRCDLVFKAHLYSHNFSNVSDPKCPCGDRLQSTQHLLLHCPRLDILREELMRDLMMLPNFNWNSFQGLNASGKVNTLLYGNESYSLAVNVGILQLVANFILDVLMVFE